MSKPLTHPKGYRTSMDTTGNDNNKISATKPEVYVLSGASNAGKTTTLNHLAWLVGNFPGSVQKNGPAPRAFGATGNRQDSRYCFHVTISQNTLIVGISTMGDKDRDIVAGFSFFDANNCDICFIATKAFGRSGHSSLKAVEAECSTRAIVPKYCYLTSEHDLRGQTAVEQAAAAFLCSFIK